MSNPPTYELSLTLVNQRSEVARIAQALEAFGKQHNLSEDDIADLNLALDEIVINIIRHGYDDDREHLIRLHGILDWRTFTIDIEDDGKPFNPLEMPRPDLNPRVEDRPIGGLGIFLVRTKMNHVEYRHGDGRNILTLTKQLSPNE